MKTFLWIIVAIIVIAGAVLLFEKHDADTGGITATSTQVMFASSTPTSAGAASTSPGAVHGMPIRGGTETVDVRISSPLIDEAVSSPLTLSGSAKGNWFFEGTAPVYLKDSSGRTLAQGHITATGDWMTTSFVPFTGMLTWSTTTSATGTVIFMNDNPSGDPALQKTVTVPVTFSR